MSTDKQHDATESAPTHTHGKTPLSEHEPDVVRLSAPKMLLVYLACPLAVTYMSLTSLLIPLRLIELGVPAAMFGLFIGAGGLLGTVMAVPSGALAQAIGPRRAYLLGAVLNGLAAVGFAISSNYWALLAIQVARGAAHSLGWVAGQTYVTGIGTPEERATIAGRFTATISSIGFFAPLTMGAIAQLVGFQRAFWFVAGYCLVFTLVGFTLPEVRTRASGTAPRSPGSLSGFGSAWGLLRIRGVRVAVLLTFVRLWIGSGWQPFFVGFLQQQGFAPFLIGTVQAANAMVSSVTGLSAGRLARLGSKEIVTVVGLVLGGVGVAISPHVAFVPLVYLPSLFMGIGSGLSMPLVMAILADQAPPGQRGVAMGLRTTGNQAGHMVAPVAMGFVVGPAGIPLGFGLNALLIWAMLGATTLLHLGGGQRMRRHVSDTATQPDAAATPSGS